MLKEFVKNSIPKNEDLKAKLEEERQKLFGYQMKIKEAKLPVMVIFEGWGAAGKGSIIGKIIKRIDPRFFQVVTMDKAPTEEEKRFPFLHRYLTHIPEQGNFKFFDTYWMREVTDGVAYGELSGRKYKELIDSINTIERQLCDNGYLVMKFFLHISKKKQKKRLEGLLDNSSASWRVDEEDILENKYYKKYLKIYDRYLTDTNRSIAPWYIIDADEKKWAELQVLMFLNQGIDTALKNHSLAVPILQNIFPLKRMPLLSEVPLDKTLTEEEYRLRLKTL